MSRSRPASNPISYHKHTKQYYITRGGRRIYLGTDREGALRKYYEFGLGIQLPKKEGVITVPITIKELANRFMAAQMANWRNRQETLKSYKHWLGRFIRDHQGARAHGYTVEQFAHWKLSLKKRGYAPETINHFLSAVRAIFKFAEEAGLLDGSPNLRRVKNERTPKAGSREKPIYSFEHLRDLLTNADIQLKAMILLALNCGFGPKDLHDLLRDDIEGQRVTLPRSKTGVCQTYLLWPETCELLDRIKQERQDRIKRLAKRGRVRSDNGHVFVTRFWKAWSKDAIAEQFRKLCKKAGVPCYGFYRLRHCASTAMSLVATPHVHRKFLRHSQLQQQVTYTHTPDAEVDKAVLKAKEKLLGKGCITSSQGRNQESGQVV